VHGAAENPADRRTAPGRRLTIAAGGKHHVSSTGNALEDGALQPPEQPWIRPAVELSDENALPNGQRESQPEDADRRRDECVDGIGARDFPRQLRAFAASQSGRISQVSHADLGSQASVTTVTFFPAIAVSPARRPGDNVGPTMRVASNRSESASTWRGSPPSAAQPGRRSGRHPTGLVPDDGQGHR
jgi:hypothetical protein